MENRRWQDGVMIVFGVWLFFSPFILQYTSYTSPAAWNSYILGVAVTVVAITALVVPHLWEEWVNFVLAVWVFVSPWVLAFNTNDVATLNHVVLGLLIAIDALWALNQRSSQIPPISHA
jgi:hypothetical protein